MLMFSGEGVSPMALISIQTGWDGDGKHCDLGDGDYSDVETVITKGSLQSLFLCLVQKSSFSLL